MWFIKDPQDQNFHPIRDILDRPTFVQLKKLAVSALMYSVVVALGMGCLIFCLRLWGSTLLPIRLKFLLISDRPTFVKVKLAVSALMYSVVNILQQPTTYNRSPQPIHVRHPQPRHAP